MKRFLHLILLCGAVLAARAQSTAFTYQGQLAAGGSPFTGFAEMQFFLFAAPAGGVALAASTPAPASVNVSGGLFATSLDFGAAAFPGADRWLEIQVRTNAGAFTTLAPRQPLTPTPYALYARTAGTAGPWALNGNRAFYSGGNVGIGTASPTAALDVRGDIRLGSSGQYRATSGEESLRIIRGTVEFNGTKQRGEGFTATYISEGDYLISFTTPFASTPSVTATVDDFVESLSIINFAVAGIFSANTSSVRIRTRIDSDAMGVPTGPSSERFHFIAIGPR